MKNLFRSFLPQRVINYFYHFPLAVLANIFYGFPAEKLKIIGVTGTDGKSTTVNMIYKILNDSGRRVSMLSTINAYIGGKKYDTGFHVTSPAPFMIQKFAREAADYRDEYLVLEVTSHALDQFRFWGIKFDVGVITNITREHLDYHKRLENYKKTKLSLLENSKHTVINQDIKEITGGRVISFGVNSGEFNQKKLKLKLKVSGEYNIENALAAIAATSILGISETEARKSVENFKGLVGRMQEVKNSRGIKIFIDFAHTPNAIDKVLNALRLNLRNGRLISLIGCEGYRDIGKREIMGEIAQRLSDIVVITAVDPRGQLNTINEQIRFGAEKSGGKIGKNLYILEDRQKAIEFVINDLAKKGDTVGVFGKGHESSMNLDGKHEIPWSELKAVEKALK